MLMVWAGLGDSIAGARVSPQLESAATSNCQLSRVLAVTMKQWHEVMAC